MNVRKIPMLAETGKAKKRSKKIGEDDRKEDMHEELTVGGYTGGSQLVRMNWQATRSPGMSTPPTRLLHLMNEIF